MKYLESSFKFLGKHFLLAIPMLLMFAVTQILMNPISVLMQQMLNEFSGMAMGGANDELMMKGLEFSQRFSAEILPKLGIVSMASLVLGLLVTPATYGVINKALSTGKADLNDFFPQFTSNVGKFIMYILGIILLYVVFIIGMVVISLIFSLLSQIGVLGGIISVLIGIVLFFGIIVFAIRLLLWFPAMISDNLGVFQAMKKSVSVVKTYFWPIVGISLLVSIGASIISSILGFLSGIPFVGPIIISIPSALSQFILIVFYFIVYRDKTGKTENEEVEVTDMPGGYL